MALARSAPRWRSRGGLRIPGQARRRKDGVGHTERPACNSRMRDLGVVYPPKPVSAGTQGHGALQYPVADAPETHVVPPRPADTVRPPAAEEDHTADRTTVASPPSAARTRITGKRRGDREDRAGAERVAEAFLLLHRKGPLGPGSPFVFMRLRTAQFAWVRLSPAKVRLRSVARMVLALGVALELG